VVGKMESVLLQVLLHVIRELNNSALKYEDYLSSVEKTASRRADSSGQMR
jgi:hypothetical protein